MKRVNRIILEDIFFLIMLLQMSPFAELSEKSSWYSKVVVQLVVCTNWAWTLTLTNFDTLDYKMKMRDERCKVQVARFKMKDERWKYARYLIKYILEYCNHKRDCNNDFPKMWWNKYKWLFWSYWVKSLSMSRPCTYPSETWHPQSWCPQTPPYSLSWRCTPGRASDWPPSVPSACLRLSYLSPQHSWLPSAWPSSPFTSHFLLLMETILSHPGHADL